MPFIDVLKEMKQRGRWHNFFSWSYHSFFHIHSEVSGSWILLYVLSNFTLVLATVDTPTARWCKYRMGCCKILCVSMYFQFVFVIKFQCHKNTCLHVQCDESLRPCLYIVTLWQQQRSLTPIRASTRLVLFDIRNKTQRHSSQMKFEKQGRYSKRQTWLV